MNFSKKEKEIYDRAVSFAREKKKDIAKELTDVEKYKPEDQPVSVFMAGSPGAGKTESSKQLLQSRIFSSDDIQVLRIDPDELRVKFSEYDGSNSYLFQTATSLLVEKTHDYVLDNNQSFILDGTFSNIDIARKNIERSLGKKRLVQILYVYQDPVQAWDFVQAREFQEGRRIPKASFIEQYFLARDTVNKLKAEFGKKIKVDLLVKSIDGSDLYYLANVNMIDNHVPEKYTKEQLEKLIL